MFGFIQPKRIEIATISESTEKSRDFFHKAVATFAFFADIPDVRCGVTVAEDLNFTEFSRKRRTKTLFHCIYTRCGSGDTRRGGERGFGGYGGEKTHFPA